MYGTLIGAGAMQNILQQPSEGNEKFTSTYGYIVHQCLNRQIHSISLKIDIKARKFSIDLAFEREATQEAGPVDTFRLAWKFRE